MKGKHQRNDYLLYRFFIKTTFLSFNNLIDENKIKYKIKMQNSSSPCSSNQVKQVCLQKEVNKMNINAEKEKQNNQSQQRKQMNLNVGMLDASQQQFSSINSQINESIHLNQDTQNPLKEIDKSILNQSQGSDFLGSNLRQIKQHEDSIHFSFEKKIKSQDSQHQNSQDYLSLYQQRKCLEINENMQEQLQENQKKLLEISQQLPYQCIGLLKSEWFNKLNHSILYLYSTGFLISEKVVITYGHNIYSYALKRHCNKVYFVPGAHGNIANTKIYSSVQQNFLHFMKESQRNGTSNAEIQADGIAMILLEEPVKLKRYLKIQHNNSIYKNRRLIVCGYPSRNYKSESHFEKIIAKRQQISGQTIQGENNNFLYYNIITKVGHSGSPVVMKCDEGYVVVGVHTHKCKTTVNSAFLFNQKNLIKILKLYKDYILSDISEGQVIKIQVKQSLKQNQELSSDLKQMIDDSIITYSFMKVFQSKDKSYSASAISFNQISQILSEEMYSSSANNSADQKLLSLLQGRQFKQLKHRGKAEEQKVGKAEEQKVEKQHSSSDFLHEINKKINQIINSLTQYSSIVTSLIAENRTIKEQDFNTLMKSLDQINQQALDQNIKIILDQRLNPEYKSQLENSFSKKSNLRSIMLDFSKPSQEIQKQRIYDIDDNLSRIIRNNRNNKAQYSQKIGPIESIHDGNCQSKNSFLMHQDEVKDRQRHKDEVGNRQRHKNEVGNRQRRKDEVGNRQRHKDEVQNEHQNELYDKNYYSFEKKGQGLLIS